MANTKLRARNQFEEATAAGNPAIQPDPVFIWRTEMGSTYSVGKTASAFRADDGKTYYALVERTFESNVYPRTPSACCVFFGLLEDCMSLAIRYSASCEGGMLKGSSGDILPESYIRQWRSALASAVATSDGDAIGRVRFGKGIYSVPDDARAIFREVFNRHGLRFDETADESSFSLRASAPAVAELVRDHGVPAWRMIEPHVTAGETCDLLSAVFPKNPAVPAISAQVFRLPRDVQNCLDDDHLIVIDGKARATGWAYSTIGAFILEEVVDAERKYLGCAEGLIRRFRESVVFSRFVAPATVVRIRRPSGLGDTAWRVAKFGELLANLRHDAAPKVFSYDAAEGTIDTTLEDIARLVHLRWLQSFNAQELSIQQLKLAPCAVEIGEMDVHARA